MLRIISSFPTFSQFGDSVTGSDEPAVGYTLLCKNYLQIGYIALCDIPSLSVRDFLLQGFHLFFVPCVMEAVASTSVCLPSRTSAATAMSSPFLGFPLQRTVFSHVNRAVLKPRSDELSYVARVLMLTGPHTDDPTVCGKSGGKLLRNSWNEVLGVRKQQFWTPWNDRSGIDGNHHSLMRTSRTRSASTGTQSFTVSKVCFSFYL